MNLTERNMRLKHQSPIVNGFEVIGQKKEVWWIASQTDRWTDRWRNLSDLYVTHCLSAGDTTKVPLWHWIANLSDPISMGSVVVVMVYRHDLK